MYKINQFFDIPEFAQNYKRTSQKIQYNLETFIQSQLQKTDDTDYTTDSEEDQNQIFQGQYLNVYYNNQLTELPVELLQIKNFLDLMDYNVFKQTFTDDEQKQLTELLPSNFSESEKEAAIEKLFTEENFFYNHPLADFMNKLQNGVFTSLRQCEQKIQAKLAQRNLLSYYENTVDCINKKIQPTIVDRIVKRTLKRKSQKEFNDAISEDSVHSEHSMHQLKPAIAFSEIGEDYATEESDYEGIREKKAELDKLKQLEQQLQREQKETQLLQQQQFSEVNISQLSQQLPYDTMPYQLYKQQQIQRIQQSQLEQHNFRKQQQQRKFQFQQLQQQQKLIQKEQDKLHDLQIQQQIQQQELETQQQKLMIQTQIELKDMGGQEENKGNIGSGVKNNEQKEQNLTKQAIEQFSAQNKLTLQMQTAEMDQEQQAKLFAAQVQKQSVEKPSKLLPSSQEWIDNYRKQEAERYQHPTQPWEYILQNGLKVAVGPVAKKIQVSLASKPRDHPLLRPERLPYITILCLVKDAAAKLPDGVGTRSDICELLKESQYVNDDLQQDKLSSIVSGALDRLHYMEDACVKYDLEKKVWIYLHRERSLSYPDWQDGDSNLKLESTKTKKRKNQMQDSLTYIQISKDQFE